MKKEKLILLIALIVGTFSVIANTFGNRELVMVTRLVFVPLIYFYYYIKVQKIGWAPTFIILLFFLTDYVNFCVDDSFLALLFIGIFNYSIFLIYGLKDMVKFKVTYMNVITLVIIISLVIFLYVNVLDIALLELGRYKIPLSIYGIVLALSAIVASYNLNYRNRSHDLMYFFCAATFIFTDVAYLINVYYFRFQMLIFLNSILQLLSYYFIARYFLMKERYDLRKKQQLLYND